MFTPRMILVTEVYTLDPRLDRPCGSTDPAVLQSTPVAATEHGSTAAAPNGRATEGAATAGTILLSTAVGNGVGAAGGTVSQVAHVVAAPAEVRPTCHHARHHVAES